MQKLFQFSEQMVNMKMKQKETYSKSKQHFYFTIEQSNWDFLVFYKQENQACLFLCLNPGCSSEIDLKVRRLM